MNIIEWIKFTHRAAKQDKQLRHVMIALGLALIVALFLSALLLNIIWQAVEHFNLI